MTTVPRFLSLVARKASPVVYHREEGGIPCPCRTPEGFRDLEWHLAHPPAVNVVEFGYEVAETFYWSRSVDGDIAISLEQQDDLLTFALNNATVRDLGPAVELGTDPSYNMLVFSSSPFDAIPGLPNNADPKTAGYHPEEVIPIFRPRCNEEGFITVATHRAIKGFVQPIQSTRATRLNTEYLEVMFGTVKADDHLGIFPYRWNGLTLNFRDWSNSGDDYVEYAGQRFLVVNANLIPDPSNGDPYHHWEVGLRLIDDTEVN